MLADENREVCREKVKLEKIKLFPRRLNFFMKLGEI